LLWSVLLLLPLSAFFSALCLAVGAYARSSKEGQYYLMPLFLVTMPLTFLTLAPGVELNAFYSMVPITGVALLLQRLMATTTGSAPWLHEVPWSAFLPVLAPMLVYSWLALRWAIEQFQREEVLFREAERLDLGLWLRHLLRDKEPLPSGGQALFCFALLLALQTLPLGSGHRFVLSPIIRYVAFVATPPVMMALLLTARPLDGLALRRPSLAHLTLAAALAILLPTAAGLLVARLDADVVLQPLCSAARVVSRLPLEADAPLAARWKYLVVLAFLPAVCEEIAFRGFLLSGLQRWLRPWAAVLVSAFLYALFRLDIVLLLPSFLAGVVLAGLVRQSGSVWPAAVVHLGWNTVLLAPALFPGVVPPSAWAPDRQVHVMELCLSAGVLVLALLCRPIFRNGSRPFAAAPEAAADSCPAGAGTAAPPPDTSAPPPY
jgi:sodium transport system permease protein